jgi:GMC oxidoreductase
MNFDAEMYGDGFVTADSETQKRLIRQYNETGTSFDVVIVGSGVGGGVLADDLADRLGKKKCRILVLEAGSFLYPTHVYNICRFPNDRVAQKFGCDTFSQPKDASKDGELFIGEKPQLNFGGRSIFWSGLIPTLQEWELDFFPDAVKRDLAPKDFKHPDTGRLHEAGEKMNQSKSLGRVAQQVVARLQNSWLAADFDIHETPRALDQPYLKPDLTPSEKFFIESTGVFNTAELLINQLGLAPEDASKETAEGDKPVLQLLLNHFVENVQKSDDGLELFVRNTVTGEAKKFQASNVVLAGGSIESPKLLLRSSIYGSLAPTVKTLVGLGLTDHPITEDARAIVDGIGGIDLSPDDHFKIIFYSRGLKESNGRIRYPFNIEMNLNHEYWHLRKNDPDDPLIPAEDKEILELPKGKSLLEIKFSFGNCLDDDNRFEADPDKPYVPKIVFRNTKQTKYLEERFRALAGWEKDDPKIGDVLESITKQIFSLFRLDGGKPDRRTTVISFGFGTVHHAAGSLRMPWYKGLDQLNKGPTNGVVDEDLQVNGVKDLYVCDMSVMPISTAANPVRALVALALRLSEHLESKLTEG